MGGPGSGHGIKRPDHSTGKVLRKVTRVKNQRKHIKSVFSDLPDPSCHGHKKARDRIVLYEEGYSKEYVDKMEIMAAERSKAIGYNYKAMQDSAQRRAEKAMQVFEDIVDDPEAPFAAKIAAAKEILDRAFGKSATLNYNVNASADAKPAELSDAELTRRIEANLSVIEGQRGEEEEAQSEKRPSDLRKYN